MDDATVWMSVDGSEIWVSWGYGCGDACHDPRWWRESEVSIAVCFDDKGLSVITNTQFVHPTDLVALSSFGE